MTDLVIRKLPFRFDEPVPFQWNPENPEFGLLANCIGFLIVSMEKLIVSLVRRVMPRIADEGARAEALAFLRQEAQHARAHQLHIAALVREHPGLASTVTRIDAAFEELERTHDDAYLLAYVAALEATFPPFFKLLLDHRESLLEPGDPRVASLFAWHFVEEIEHRASALVVYDAVVGEPWTRLRVVGPALAHAISLFGMILEEFEQHVPLEARMVETSRLDPRRSWFREVFARLPRAHRAQAAGPKTAFHAVPARELAETVRRLVLAQLPTHRPADEPVPAWVETWSSAYVRGEDMTRFVGRPSGATA